MTQEPIKTENRRSVDLNTILGPQRIAFVRKHKDHESLVQFLFSKFKDDVRLCSRLKRMQIDLKYLCYAIEHLRNQKQL